MANALDLFNQPKASLPTHVADFLSEESNITDRATVPSLSYEGKVWTISLNGEKTKMTKRDDEGDEVPLPIMRVVVLDYAKRRGRAYYEGTYDPTKASAPLCWSEDGVLPDESVEEKQNDKCDGCPMSIKGSRTTDSNKAVAACSQHRMLAVVPSKKLDMDPLRLKLAVTSDWDKNSPELEAAGWFAFNNYTDMLRSKGVQHTAALVTKMRFDPNVAYPKVMFSPDRWLTPEEIALIAPIVKGDAVKKLVAGTWTPAGVDGVAIAGPEKKAAAAAPKKAAVQVDDDDEDMPVVPAKGKKAPVTIEHDPDEVIPARAKADKKAAVIPDDDEDEDEIPVKPKADKKAAAAAPVEDEDEDDEEAQLERQLAAAKAKKAAAAAKAAKAAQAAVDEDDTPVAATPAKGGKKGAGKAATAAAEPAKPAKAASVPADVASLLEEWGED